jgi:ATP-dependent Clp protease ATP-binding subunit ClpC
VPNPNRYLARVPSWLSPEAEVALSVAEEEARQRRQAIGTPHLLLGLVADQDGRAADVLRAMGYSVPQVRYEAARKLGTRSQRPSRRRPVRSARVEDSLGRALAEAQRQGKGEVDPEDILLALVADPEGKAASILKRLPRTQADDDDSGRESAFV